MRFAMWALLAACAAPVAPVVSNTAPAPAARPPAPGPVTLHARVIKVDFGGHDVIVELTAGSDLGVDARATIVAPKFPDARVVLVRVNKTTTLAKTTMTPEQIGANPDFDIILAPPPS